MDGAGPGADDAGQTERAGAIVLLTALPARLLVVPFAELTPHWNVVVNLLAGSLLGA